MSHVNCSACRDDVTPTPPSAGYWALIVGFWIASLAFGFMVAFGSGAHITLIVAWSLLATTAGALAKHASSWTCPECGAPLAPPAESAAEHHHV